MMASAHSSSSNGLDEAKGPEIQGKPLAAVPFIDLPHRWDENGRLVPETSPLECPLCEWTGGPEDLFAGPPYHRLTGKDCTQEPFKCASCEILRCTLFKTAEIERRPVTERSSVFGAHTYSSVTLDGLNHIWQSISISSDTPDSDIGRYNVGRQLMSSDERLCDGSSKWAQDRLAECASSHELCQSQSGYSFLPTRLINLQPGWKGLDVRLEDSHSVRSGSLYVSLSYCWGHHRPACTTTVETLARNKTRIPWDALPLTFQDAAAFTLSLGVQYLWIDSICIIQEDEKDWQQEAGKMYAVYKNSYLTLAALTGRDSTSGLRNMSIRQDSVLLAKLRIDQAIYPLYLRRNHYLDGVDAGNIKGSFADTCRRYPLLSRAWAYQERTISPRVIFFTESEMIFQCLNNANCECGATPDYCLGEPTEVNLDKTDIFLKTRIGSPTEGSSEEDISLGSMSVQKRSVSGPGIKEDNFLPVRSRDDTQAKDSTIRQAADTWRRTVVFEYSALAVTMPRDRLPALGAIAEQFQRVRVGEAYLAGLWSGSLLDDLLWISNSLSHGSPKSKERLERPFSLPTWSWASLNIGSNIVYVHNGVTVPRAKVLEANCSYLGNTTSGVLQSSKLVLRGRVLHSLLKWTDAAVSIYLRNGDAWRVFSNPLGPKQAGDSLAIDMDQDQDGFQNIPSHQEIDFLEISISRSTGSWLFLLLRREDPDHFVYTRAGKATVFLNEVGADEQGEGDLPQDGFESIFEGQSVMTTCEIR